jgi:hypothetical protein
LEADDPPVADGQERGPGLIDFQLVGPADDVQDDRGPLPWLISIASVSSPGGLDFCGGELRATTNTFAPPTGSAPVTR